MSGRIVALVACVKSKRSSACAAADLYTSALFVKSRAYAERYANEWFILSAQHGLVSPQTLIAPYEQTLKGAGRAAQRAWAERAHGQMAEAGLLDPAITFLWLAGREYSRDLRELLPRHRHLNPMAGLVFGRRLAWLGQQLAPGREPDLTHELPLD